MSNKSYNLLDNIKSNFLVEMLLPRIDLFIEAIFSVDNKYEENCMSTMFLNILY